MAAVRRCRVSVTDADGVTHSVEVHGASVYDVASAALAQFTHEGWVDTLSPTAVLQVEVHVPPTIHRVPLKTLQRWADGPSVSPKEDLLKRPLRRS
jgi:hypothetical protein